RARAWFFFSSRRRHTRFSRDWSSDVCSSDLEVHFETRVTDFTIKNNQITDILLQNGNEMPVERVILATGHSARDIFYLLHNKNRSEERRVGKVGRALVWR